MAKISYHDFLLKYHDITIPRFYRDFIMMLVLLFCLNSVETKPFKVTKYKYVYILCIFRPKWAKIKIFVIILSSLLKIRTKIHITNTHYIQIKQTVFYFQVQ